MKTIITLLIFGVLAQSQNLRAQSQTKVAPDCAITMQARTGTGTSAIFDNRPQSSATGIPCTEWALVASATTANVSFTVQAESAQDNGAANCAGCTFALFGVARTTPGVTLVKNTYGDYLRINLSAINTGTVSAILYGWRDNPSSIAGSGAVTGTGVAPQVTVWTGPTTIGGFATLTFNSAQQAASIGTGQIGLSALGVVPKASGTLAGTTTVNSSQSVTGVGTLFLTQVGFGDTITFSSGSAANVIAIGSNTALTVDALVGDGTSQTMTIEHATAVGYSATSAPSLVMNDNAFSFGALTGFNIDWVTMPVPNGGVLFQTSGSANANFRATGGSFWTTTFFTDEGTLTTPVVSQSGDGIAWFKFNGGDSNVPAQPVEAARIQADVEGVSSPGVVPGSLTFKTRDGSGAHYMIQHANGNLNLPAALVDASVVFASLPTPSDGMQIYCSDCTVTSGIDNTCKATGSGAQAFRVNGAWKCVL
jgi:hypothetical protein